jgi:hypothetical protein
MTADVFFQQPTRRKTMKEEQKHKEVKDDAQNEGEAAPTATAPAKQQPDDDDVLAFSEPSDGSGGGK